MIVDNISSSDEKGDIFKCDHCSGPTLPSSQMVAVSDRGMGVGWFHPKYVNIPIYIYINIAKGTTDPRVEFWLPK